MIEISEHINIHEMEEDDILGYVDTHDLSYEQLRAILVSVLLRSVLRNDMLNEIERKLIRIRKIINSITV